MCIMAPMNRLKDIAIILMTNAVGFLSVSICFYTLLVLGIVTEDFFVNASQISFESWASGVFIVWIVCLLFSLAALAIKQKERLVLMVSPAIIPILYGFSVLVLFGGV